MQDDKEDGNEDNEDAEEGRRLEEDFDNSANTWRSFEDKGDAQGAATGC